VDLRYSFFLNGATQQKSLVIGAPNVHVRIKDLNRSLQASRTTISKQASDTSSCEVDGAFSDFASRCISASCHSIGGSHPTNTMHRAESYQQSLVAICANKI
jgi:hypothetical protein